MRGRKPRPIEIASDDLPILQQIARSQIRPWYQVRRARILLGIADGARTQTLALQTQCDESTVRRTCHRYQRLGLSGLLDSPTRSGRPIAISPPATCPDRRTGLPGARGRGLAHHPLDQRGLGRSSRRRRHRPGHQRRTVRRILHDVDLQPHRTRYWRTARLDAQFKQRAEKVLWCYANADRLAKQGYWVVCADEIPNHQVLERHPIRRSIPGSIEQREFEYTRHGTVNILNFLIVHSGRMEATCVETKDAAHYIEELETIPASPSPPAGRVPDSRRRSQPHRRADARVLPILSRVVASPVHSGPCVLARSGRDPQQCLRLPLPEARVVEESGGVHRSYCRLVAGIQRTLRPSL